jgi:hypothetical protein
VITTMGQSSHLTNEPFAEVFMRAPRALHKAASRPSGVVRVGLASANVPLDLGGNPGRAPGHPTHPTRAILTRAILRLRAVWFTGDARTMGRVRPASRW